MLTTIDWLFELLDHKLFILLEDVKVTFPPLQNVVGPLGVIEGIEGAEFTLTDIKFEEGDTQPLIDDWAE